MLGVNVNALLLPAGVALAYAAKDLSHNFLAGEGLRHARLRPSAFSALADASNPTAVFISPAVL